MKFGTLLRTSAVCSVLVTCIECGREDASQQSAQAQQQQKPIESKLSDAATAVILILASRPGETKIFCGDYLSLTYNNSTASTDQQVLNEVKYYTYLEQNGYATKMRDTWSPQGLAGLSRIAGTVEYRFAPAQKFLDLFDRRSDDGCYWTKNIMNSNPIIKGEQVHPQYKSVTTVYVEFDQQVSRYDAFWLPLHGLPGGGRMMARALVIEHPVTHQPQVRRADGAPLGGNWTSDLVPEALVTINLGGPDALK